MGVYGLLKKNRDQLSIIGAILEVTISGSSKTKIMKKSNLSFTLLKKYLIIVINSGLVTFNDNFYSLTPRGRFYLNEYRNLETCYIKAQESLEDVYSKRKKLIESINCFVMVYNNSKFK